MSSVWECPYDPGGYFIVRGQEKVVLAQEQGAKNRMIVDTDKSGNVTCYATSFTYERKSRTTVSCKKGGFYLIHNSFDSDIPIVVVFYAMGLQRDKSIYELIAQGDPNLERLMQKSFMEFSLLEIHTSEEALEWLKDRLRGSGFLFGRSRTKIDEVRFLIRNLMLAHVQVQANDDYTMKIWYLALMVRRCALAVNDPKLQDDRDHYGNKRLEFAGQLISLLFEDLLKRLNWDLKNRAEKHLPRIRAFDFDVATHISPNIITHGLRNAIATGNWTLKRFRLNRAGITQVLSRLSFMSALGTISRVQAQFEKSRKIAGPRSVHSSQWGVICPVDTPEGESCGLLKSLAMTAQVTVDEDEEQVAEQLMCNTSLQQYIKPLDTKNTHDLNMRVNKPVFLNGVIIGLVDDHEGFARSGRELRRTGALSPFVSVSYSKLHNFVHVSCDGGRLCRPYIICDPGVPRVTDAHLQAAADGSMQWSEFITRGLIEYLDVNELNNTYIADWMEELTSEHTHLSIAPFTMLGVVAGLIPFPDHNQSPRNTYQCAMGKQSMGLIGLNASLRFDTVQYGLVYPQRPLVDTVTYPMIGFRDLPAGQNAMVAVMSYSGYDIEDAIILNRASLDRSFALCTVHEKLSTSFTPHSRNGKIELLEDPNNDTSPFTNTRLSKLERDGLVGSGCRLYDKDVVINKCTVILPEAAAAAAAGGADDAGAAAASADQPQLLVPGKGFERVYFEQWDAALAETVVIAAGAEDTNVVKVRIRQTRRPEVGDKFSSRHGQKGVVGLVVPQENMPYMENGVCPDLIMNPHGFPSRMTVGKLIECLAGKVAASTGQSRDSTAFQGDTTKFLMHTLTANGFNYGGKEVMYCGLTGQPLNAYIFFGPIYYQRLKHMVADKIHARGEGPVQQLSRQPTEGRSRDGGLRLGEMERDCLVAHGAAEVIRERFLVSSDQYFFDICARCGMLTNFPQYCALCKDGSAVRNVSMPYAFKLLVQELMSMNVVPRFKLDANMVCAVDVAHQVASAGAGANVQNSLGKSTHLPQASSKTKRAKVSHTVDDDSDVEMVPTNDTAGVSESGSGAREMQDSATQDTSSLWTMLARYQASREKKRLAVSSGKQQEQRSVGCGSQLLDSPYTNSNYLEDEEAEARVKALQNLWHVIGQRFGDFDMTDDGVQHMHGLIFGSSSVEDAEKAGDRKRIAHVSNVKKE